MARLSCMRPHLVAALDLEKGRVALVAVPHTPRRHALLTECYARRSTRDATLAPVRRKALSQWPPTHISCRRRSSSASTRCAQRWLGCASFLHNRHETYAGAVVTRTHSRPVSACAHAATALPRRDQTKPSGTHHSGTQSRCCLRRRRPRRPPPLSRVGPMLMAAHRMSSCTVKYRAPAAYTGVVAERAPHKAVHALDLVLDHPDLVPGQHLWRQRLLELDGY